MQNGLLVERVDPRELELVARVLAEAYTEDPIHLWAMPKAATRLEDATVFFTFFLRWMRPHSWDVFATADRSAVLVTWLVRQGKSGYPDGVRFLPPLLRRKSPLNDFLQWVETLRPEVDHLYFEFLGSLPNARRGIGFLLVANVLEKFNPRRLPIWAWLSNPRLTFFYRRLGFEIGPELRRDDNTPPVTTIWRPVMPIAASSTGSH
jgi:ribosomal protein S18 acetylase RimI-like enzyme